MEASNISGLDDEDALSFFIVNGTSAHFCGEQRANESLDLREGWLLNPQSTCNIARKPELLIPGSFCKSQNSL
jgi:hypothetical protein